MGVTTVVKDYGTEILDAIRESNLKKFSSLVEKHLRTEQQFRTLCITDICHRPTKKFACPLILAARQSDPAIVEYMLKRGVDPDFVHLSIYTSRREKVTALHIAVDLSYYDTVEALLNFNANANTKDHNDETPLHIAVKKADRVMVRMLLARGADASVVDQRGNAALHIATLYGHLQLVKTLLKYDADLYQKGAGGIIPSHIAAREGHIHLIQVFCSRDAGNINTKIPCFSDDREVAPLHLAAQNGHVETVIALLDQFHADINLKDSHYNTPLHCVVLERYHQYRMRDRDFFYATAKVLVRYRVPINEKNNRGHTALHLAAKHKHPKIVELLLNIGANPFIENDDHMKPIDLVSEKDAVTRQLLKSAMANPRQAPMDVSRLSIQNDLQNLSYMPGINLQMMSNGVAPNQTSTLRRLPHSGVPSAVFPANHIPGISSRQSFRSVSGSTIGVVDDGKLRSSGTQARGWQGAKHLGSLENEVTSTNRRGDRSQPTAGRAIISPIEPVNVVSRDDRHRTSDRHRRTSESTAENRNRLPSDSNDPKQLSRKARHSDESRKERSHAAHDSMKNRSFEVSGRSDKNRSHHRRSQSMSDDEERRRRKDKHRKHGGGKSGRKSEDDILDEAEDEIGGYGDDDDEAGIRVTTVPGKPRTIEVEYAGGPILIAVDTQADELETSHRQQVFDDDDEQDSSSDDDDDRSRDKRGRKHSDHHRHRHHHRHHSKDRNRSDDKKHRHKHRHHDRSKNESMDAEDREVMTTMRYAAKYQQPDDEPLYMNQEEVGKSGKRRKEKGEPIYSNQNEMLNELQRNQEKARLLEEQKMLESERIQRELEKQQMLEDEEKRLRREERERRRAKKLQRRQQRQDFQEPEKVAVLDSKPVVMYSNEALNHPAYDSDELEEEQHLTLESVKKKAWAVATSVISRWSEAEEELHEANAANRSGLNSTDSDIGGGAKKTKKPPRPGLADSDTGHSDVPMDMLPVPTPSPRTSLINMKNQPVDDSQREGKFETVAREMRHEINFERATVFTVKPLESSSSDKWVDAKVTEKLEHFAEEPIPSDTSLAQHMSSTVEEGTMVMQNRSATGSPSASRRGLNLRVTGEVPKAYTRADKSSARAAFILAAPVGIESGSEMSDSEFGTPLNNVSVELSDTVKAMLEQVPGNAETGKGADEGKQGSPVKMIGTTLYAKPYTSFGKIEPKVDALVDAMEEEEELRLRSEFKDIHAPVMPVVSNAVEPPVNQLSTLGNESDGDSSSSSSSSSSSDGLREMRREPAVRHANDGLIRPKKVIGVPTPFADMTSQRGSAAAQNSTTYTGPVPPPTGNNLNRSGDALSFADDLEEYDEEPSFRRPDSTMSVDSELDDYEREPARRRADKKPTTVVAVDDKQNVAEASKPRDKTGVKKTKKKKRTYGDEDQTATVSAATGSGISNDVWQEAMSSQPLASSERFDLVPDKKRSAKKDDSRSKVKATRDANKGSVLQWNTGCLSDDDLSKETLDDISYSSYIMTESMIANNWDENYNETNLDDCIEANQTPAKNLELRPRDPSSSVVVGRRRQRLEGDRVAGNDEASPGIDKGDESPEQKASKDSQLKREKRQRPDNRKVQRRLSATIPIVAAAAEDLDVLQQQSDDEPYDQTHGTISADVSIQPWENVEDSLSEEDLNPLPPFGAAGYKWETGSLAASETSFSIEPGTKPRVDSNSKPMPLPKPRSLTGTSLHSNQQSPMKRQIPPLSQPTGAPKPEMTEGIYEEIPGSMENIEAFVRGDSGSVRRTPVTRGDVKNRQPFRDAYASETEASRRRYDSDVPYDATEPRRNNKDTTATTFKSLRFSSRNVYSEAEASDFEGPPALSPGKSVKQAALEALALKPMRRKNPVESVVPRMIQPGHRDKNFNHIRRFIRPKTRKRVRGLTFIPSSGRYGDSLLDGSRRRSDATDSEMELDESVHTVLAQNDVVCRLWMEQVYSESVTKSETMFLSVFPPGRELPGELTANYKQPLSLSGDTAAPPQWVMARSRTHHLRHHKSTDSVPGMNFSKFIGGAGQGNLPNVLFFKVGSNWMDMAWVLFDGLQTDPETVRMIRDIQLKNPGGLSDQMHELMRRWWRRKGRYATLDQLRQALDSVHIPYIVEQITDPNASVAFYTDTEDDLDRGEIPESDPHVSRLIETYNVRSLNASYNVHNYSAAVQPPALPSNPPPDGAQRNVAKQKLNRSERLRSSGSSYSSELRPMSTSRYTVESGRDSFGGGHDSGSEDKKRITAVVLPQPAEYDTSKRVTNL